MRIAILVALVALGCSGSGGKRATGPAAIQRPESAKRYTATQFLPAKPSYALAARTVREAQRSIRDAIDGAGAIASLDAAEVGRQLKAIFAIDPLDPDALKGIGVDLEGGIAMFSEGVNPTIVVRLASPAQLQAWVDQLRGLGMKTESVVVDGAEVFTTRAAPSDNLGTLAVSWVVVDDWCWVHLALPKVPDDSKWLQHSREPAGADWIADWSYAHDSAGGEPAFIGFFDLKRVLASVVAGGPNVVACTKLLDPVQHVAIAVDGDAHHVAAKLAIDLGPAAATVGKSLLGRPERWDEAATSAAIALQWNLDFPVFRAWLSPCLALHHVDLHELDALGIRAARAMLHAIDLGEPSGRGVVALDLSRKQFFADQLDRIPLRRTLESKRAFGPHQGASLSIPFGPRLDYVLTDRVGLFAMGEGLLAQVVGSGKITPGPIVAIDLAPRVLSRETWLEVLKLVDEDGWLFGRRFVDLLLRWKSAHVALAVDGTRLVLTANGTRL